MANFIPLDVGLQAATLAQGGPKISIAAYRIGSSNAPAVKTQTGIQGTLLHRGSVTQVYPVSEGTVNVVVNIPSNVGPFEFGEVVLELADGTAFARLNYNTKQEKISALTLGIGGTWRLNCLLKLGHHTAVLNYTSVAQNEVLTIDGQAVVSPGELSTTTSQANLIVATMLTGEYSGGAKTPVILKRLSDSEWDPEEFEFNSYQTAQSGTTTTLFVSNWLNANVTAHLKNYGYCVLLQSANGRVVTCSVNASGHLVLAYPCSWCTPGAQVRAYFYETVKGSVINAPMLRERTSYEPVIGMPAYEVGMRGTPVRLWKATENLAEVGNGLMWYVFADGAGGPADSVVQLPDLPLLAFENVSNLGWQTTVYNHSLSDLKITVKPPPGGSFMILDRYQGAFGREYSTADLEIARRGKVTFTYGHNDSGSWKVMVEGTGILGHNFGGPYIIGQIYLLPHASPPPGFRWADRTLNPNTGFPEVYAIYGETFNLPGDPSGYFRLPDARGQHFRATDRGAGIDPGRLVNTYQLDAVKSHTHPLQVDGSNDDNGNPGPLVNTNFDWAQPNGIQPLAGNSIAKASLDAAPENRVKTLAQNAFIFVAR